MTNVVIGQEKPFKLILIIISLAQLGPRNATNGDGLSNTI